MALPQSSRVRRQLGAKYHLQLRNSTPAITQTGTAVVSGVVEKVFRGDGEIKPGDSIAISIYVYREKAPWGDGCSLHVDDLNHASYLEVFLDGEPAVYSLAWPPRVIGPPTETPRITPHTKADLLGGKHS